MKVAGQAMRAIWLAVDGRTVEIIDQTRLPHELIVARLACLDDAARAIREMQVRGAPLIGATAAYGMALAVAEDPSDRGIEEAAATLAATRPTAVNLAWALTELRRALADVPRDRRAAAALARAEAIADEDVAINRALGEHGIGLIEGRFAKKAAGSRSSPIAMPAGSRRSIGAPRWRRSTAPMTRAFRSMSGSTKPGRATRAPASPPGNWVSTACRIRSLPTMPGSFDAPGRG